jgi:uncharacterized protein
MPRAILIVIAFFLPAPASAQTDALLNSLEPQGHVSDFAGVMGPQRAGVEALLAELQQKTGAEVAVVTLTTLDDGEPADFANRLFERWGIGPADSDRGILLLTAIEDRAVQIEVGYGLEPLITDAGAGRILDEQVLPYFRQMRYGEGLAAGAATLARIVAEDAGVELTGQSAVPTRPQEESRSPLGGVLRLLFLLLLIPIIIRNPWLALLLLSGGGRHNRGGGGFGRGGGGGFGGFGGGMSGGGGAGRSW